MNGLEGNIIKYNLFKIFTKRVFLPLIAIYLVDVGRVSLVQLGIIASVTAIASIILEIPTGYLADHWGHKKSIVFGSFLATFSVIPYIFYPGFVGGLIASVGFFAGYSFTSGTMQAFIHETLLALKIESEYSKLMGRAQSYGLAGNIILVSVIPLSYGWNHQLPFVLGFICLLISALIAASFKNPPQRFAIDKDKKNMIRELHSMLKAKSWIKMLVVFLIFGIVSAGFDQTGLFRELAFRSINIPVQYFGFILAAGSLLAAITGAYIHKLDRLSTENFLYFDVIYLTLVYLLIGISKIPTLIVLGFILIPTYSRTRSIIYEAKLFKEFGLIRHKATLLSILNFFAFSNGIWVPLLLSLLVRQTNIIFGHAAFGLSLFLILFPLAIYHGRLRQREKLA